MGSARSVSSPGRAPQARPPRGARLPELDTLRAVGLWLVVVWHLTGCGMSAACGRMAAAAAPAGSRGPRLPFGGPPMLEAFAYAAARTTQCLMLLLFVAGAASQASAASSAPAAAPAPPVLTPPPDLGHGGARRLAAWAGAPLALGLAVQLLLDPGLLAAMGAGSHLRPGEDPAAHVWFFYALAGARALTFALGRALPGARNKGARVALAFAVATLATWLWPGAREAAAEMADPSDYNHSLSLWHRALGSPRVLSLAQCHALGAEYGIELRALAAKHVRPFPVRRAAAVVVLAAAFVSYSYSGEGIWHDGWAVPYDPRVQPAMVPWHLGYEAWTVAQFSLWLAIVPSKPVPLLTALGGATLAPYVYHKYALMLLFAMGVQDHLVGLPAGVLLLLTFALPLAVFAALAAPFLCQRAVTEPQAVLGGAVLGGAYLLVKDSDKPGWAWALAAAMACAAAAARVAGGEADGGGVAAARGEADGGGVAAARGGSKRLDEEAAEAAGGNKKGGDRPPRGGRLALVLNAAGATLAVVAMVLAVQEAADKSAAADSAAAFVADAGAADALAQASTSGRAVWEARGFDPYEKGERRVIAEELTRHAFTAAGSQYTASFVPLPEAARGAAHQVVGFALVTSSPGHLHHSVARLCRATTEGFSWARGDGDAFARASLEYYDSDRDGPNIPKHSPTEVLPPGVFCREIATVWAKGLTSIKLRADEGVTVGEGSDIAGFLIDTHFDFTQAANRDNSRLNPVNTVDRSGFVMYFTPDLRPQEAHAMFAGSDGPGITIAADSVGYVLTVTELLDGLSDAPHDDAKGDGDEASPRDFDFRRIFFHAHGKAAAFTASLARPDGARLQDLGTLGARGTFDGVHKLQVPGENAPAVMRPGDLVALTCVYDNRGHNATVHGGRDWFREMCAAFVGVAEAGPRRRAVLATRTLTVINGVLPGHEPELDHLPEAVKEWVRHFDFERARAAADARGQRCVSKPPNGTTADAAAQEVLRKVIAPGGFR